MIQDTKIIPLVFLDHQVLYHLFISENSHVSPEIVIDKEILLILLSAIEYKILFFFTPYFEGDADAYTM